ncbi:MAG TPA: hypothetical protein VF516_00715 [Kofleriaceae bacterium]
MPFANAGSGIFLVSDHSGAKRCSACTEAWQVINGFLTTGAATAFGVKVVVNSSAGGFLVASQLTTGGRLVVLGDSSPADDGTCTGCSASLHDGWDEGSARAFSSTRPSGSPTARARSDRKRSPDRAGTSRAARRFTPASVASRFR